MPKIAKVVIGLPLEGPFDYLIPSEFQENIKCGTRVYVPFGNRKLVGVTIGFSQKSLFKNLKSILFLLDETPSLDKHALQLTKAFSEYYACSWGEAIESFLPPILRTKSPTEFSLKERKEHPATAIGDSTTSLKPEYVFCHDPSAYQRWDYMLEKIKDTLLKEKGIIILVPEVVYIDKIRDLLNNAGISSFEILGEKKAKHSELEQWLAIRGGKVRIVIGTRSAVFAPVCSLGLIIVVDEDHLSFKQEQSPFYHAREVAHMRAEIEKCSLLFVGASPSAELWHQIKTKKMKYVALNGGPISPLKTIDLSNYKPQKKSSISIPLINDIQETLSRKGKIVLLFNKRGFGVMTNCQQCGNVLKCKRCDSRLTYLFSKKKLLCHLCQQMTDKPDICPNCGQTYLRSSGIGIEKMESDLARLFPQAKIAKYDRDTSKLPEGVDIIIATQAILKEIKDLKINLIGVIDIDSELNRVDFRSAQRTFALLIFLRQVAVEKVAVQTYQGDNYCLTTADKMDFDGFYARELRYRKDLGFPPFWHLVSVCLRGKKEEVVFQEARNLYDLLTRHAKLKGEIHEPHPDIVPKLRDKYRFTIMLKGKKVENMITSVKSVLRNFKKKHDIIIAINVDP